MFPGRQNSKMNNTNNVFYASLCHVCKQHTADLKRCAGCKTFQYCSKEHQKQDWPEHKQFCKAIHVTNIFVTYKIGCSIKQWRRHRLELREKWQHLLKRELLAYEQQVWMFPRACAHCFSKNANLEDCSECLNVAYCCLEHKQTHQPIHANVCEKLKLCMEIDRYLIQNENHCSIMRVMPHLNGGEEFPANITEVLTKFFGETNKVDSIDFALKSDCLTSFATIAYVLSNFVDLKQQGKLVVHLVGAGAFEAVTDWHRLSENLFHCLPTIKSIEWIFIGPEAAADCHHHCQTETPCECCLKENRYYTIKTHKTLYEDVFEELSAPHLVVALNSGIHEFDDDDEENNTWKNSIPYLLRRPDVPLLLTAYTNGELLQDLRCIMDCNNDVVRVQMDAQVNQYASLRPIRDWDCEESAISVFYNNGYVAVVEKSQ